jgi:ABC-type uncharacterized transport system substrate-binding protein
MLLSRHTRRREFITLLGGAAVAWPLAARAQQRAMPVIGFLDGGTAVPQASNADAFRRGLGEVGFVEGKNLMIEYRWAEGANERLPALAADLVRRQVAVIAATGGQNSAQAAKSATKTIPIVFANGGDPVELGLVTSLNRPAGNATGVSFYLGPLASKRLELLRDLRPNAASVAVLANPNNPASEAASKDTQAAARRIGLQTIVLNASNPNEIDSAFSIIERERPAALLTNVDVFLATRRDQIVALSARHGIPAIYGLREFVAGWPDELWKQCLGRLSSGWRLYGQNSQGCKAR